MINFMVPVPNTAANIDAVAKPFQWPVKAKMRDASAINNSILN